MSDIAPISQPNPPSLGSVNRPVPAANTGAVEPSGRRADRVELSIHSQLMSRLHNLPIRSDLVNRVRQEIAQGTYDTPEKVEALMGNLAQDLQ